MATTCQAHTSVQTLSQIMNLKVPLQYSDASKRRSPVDEWDQSKGFVPRAGGESTTSTYQVIRPAYGNHLHP